jgi:two-component system OmpR family sensor kinase
VPIRLRLTLVFALGVAILLTALGAFLYVRLRGDLLESVDFGLRGRAQVLSDAIAAGRDPDLQASGQGPTDTDEDVAQVPDTPGSGADLEAAGQGLIDPDEAFAQVLDPTGHIVQATSAVQAAPLIDPTAIPAGPEPAFITADVPGFDDPVRMLAVATHGPAGPVSIVVGSTLGNVSDATGSLLLLLATVGPAALAATTVGGWFLAGAALRPVERLRREATALSSSDPGRRLPVPGTRDELARLATTLNDMLDRLQIALERERRFVDDASHELRTPLATMRGEIELALARPRSNAELGQSLVSVQDDVDRLQRLADDLLVLARTRGGRIPVRRVRCSLAALAAEGARAVEPFARESGVTVAVTASTHDGHVDPDRIRQALRNLLENAIRHSPDGGTVRLTADRDRGWVHIVVEDSGPGFPPDLLTAVFDPFVRGAQEGADRSGAGLGLAIVRAVAEAHGGTVYAQNAHDGGRVTMDLRA